LPDDILPVKDFQSIVEIQLAELKVQFNLRPYSVRAFSLPYVQKQIYPSSPSIRCSSCIHSLCSPISTYQGYWAGSNVSSRSSAVRSCTRN